MNWLPLILVIFVLKNFTSRKGSTGSENLLSLLKLAATAKESGLFELLKSERPLSSLFSGEFPVENLLGILSSFMENKAPAQNFSPNTQFPSEELTGEEMGSILRRFLEESPLVTG